MKWSVIARWVLRVFLVTLETLLPLALALWLLWPLIRLPRPPELLPIAPTSSTFPKAQPKPVIEEAAGCDQDKRTCSDMESCEQARFYLNHCDRPRLDGDKDGIPCESMCDFSAN